MTDNRTASAIDLALQKYDTPVGDLYVAMRHGRMKRFFSRDTAIRWLAHFLTSHSFAHVRKNTRLTIGWVRVAKQSMWATA